MRAHSIHVNTSHAAGRRRGIRESATGLVSWIMHIVHELGSKLLGGSMIRTNPALCRDQPRVSACAGCSAAKRRRRDGAA